ncbi:MAG: hypothetical protein R2828_04530 [Saprospiraceae bacterium]
MAVIHLTSSEPPSYQIISASASDCESASEVAQVEVIEDIVIS